MADRHVDPHRGNEEPDEQRCEVLRHRAGSGKDRAGEPQRRQPEILVARKADREAGQLWCSQREDRDPDHAAQRRGEQRHEQNLPRLALLREAVAIVHIGGRGGRPGHAQQRARDVAGKDRRGRRRRDGGDGRDRVHEERERDQQRHRHGRGQPGHRADEGAVQRCEQDDREVVQREDGGKHLVKHQRRPSSGTALTMRRASARPRGAGRAASNRRRRKSPSRRPAPTRRPSPALRRTRKLPLPPKALPQCGSRADRASARRRPR